MGIKSPNFTNVIDYINDTNLPVYEINQKSLRRVN